MPTFRDDLHLGHSVPMVDTEDIVDGAVTEPKLADDSVSTRTIQDGAVTEPKIAEKAVTEPKLADAAVSTRTIKFRAVTESKIGDSAVSTRTIQNGAVTNPKIANGAVSMNKLDNETQTLIQRGADSSWTPMGDYDVDALYYANDLVFDPETNSSYISLRADNMGHPVTDETWWMKVLDGSYVNRAIEEMEAAIAQAIEDAQEDIDDAIAGANTAAQTANTAAQAATTAKNTLVTEISQSLAVYETVADSITTDPEASTGLLPVQNYVLGKAIVPMDNYIHGDVRILAAGQAYNVDEAVTYDSRMLRMTKEVKLLNFLDAIAAGDLKAYNNATYKALAAITAYDNATTTYTEGDYAVGRPAVMTVTVDVSGFIGVGDISVTIGTETVTYTVASEDTAASIAAAIVTGIGTIDGWTITDNEDGTITIQCDTAGANTLTFSSTGAEETGVSVTQATTAGSDEISVYNNNTWSPADLNTMTTDTDLFESVNTATLASTYTQANDVMMDAMGTRTEDYPEFVKTALLYISSATKLSTSSSYYTTLFRLKKDKTYTINQIAESNTDNQRAVAVIASEANFVNGGTIKQVLANGRKSSALFPTGIKYTPDVDEFLVIQGSYSGSVCASLWFNAQVDIPQDRNNIVDDEITNLKEEIYGKTKYNAVTPIGYIKGASCDGRGLFAKSNTICYLYKLDKGKTYNVSSINYSSAYSGLGGVYELESPSHFMLGGGGVCKILSASTISETFICTKDTYIVTKGYNESNNSNIYAICIVREVADAKKNDNEIVIRTMSVPVATAGTIKKQLSPAGAFTSNNTGSDSITSFRAYANRTYRITQLRSTSRVLACRWHESGYPENMTMLDEIIAVGYPNANNFSVVDYTPAEDCYILVQTNSTPLTSIVEVFKKDAKTYLTDNVDNRQVTRADMTDVVVCGSSQTEADYQPMGFAWMERLNDILDLNFHNDGKSGYNFNENLSTIMRITGNNPEPLGVLGDNTYRHRQVSARYYMFQNSANNTPYGATAYTQLQKSLNIASSLGAKVLFGNEAANGSDNIAYSRRAFSNEKHIPYVSVLEEWKKCYPFSSNASPEYSQPYKGWFYGVHLGYRAFAIYERYIEMLERIPIQKSVKLFKVRPMYKGGSPTISDLIYDSNLGRLRYFTAISCGSKSGRSTAQIDNLDNDNYKVEGGDNTGVRTNENAALKVGNAVSFNHIALIEFILERVKITRGTFEIDCSVQPTNVYIAIVRTNGSIRTAWESISYTKNGNLLTAKISRDDYDIQMDDKVRILIECEGAFTLANPIFRDYNGKPKEYREESIEGYHERLYGAELNQQTGFPVDTHGWTLTGNAKVVALPSQIANYTAYNSYNSHLQLDDNAASATKTISIERGTSQVAIRVVCCVYPKIATTRFNVDGQVPEALQEYVANDAPQIRTYEYDYGTLALTVNDCAIRKALVWAGWAELYFEVDVPPTATSIKLQIGRETFTDASYNVNSWPMFIHDVSVQKIR